MYLALVGFTYGVRSHPQTGQDQDKWFSLRHLRAGLSLSASWFSLSFQPRQTASPGSSRAATTSSIKPTASLLTGGVTRSTTVTISLTNRIAVSVSLTNNWHNSSIKFLFRLPPEARDRPRVPGARLSEGHRGEPLDTPGECLWRLLWLQGQERWAGLQQDHGVLWGSCVVER